MCEDLLTFPQSNHLVEKNYLVLICQHYVQKEMSTSHLSKNSLRVEDSKF